jgi:hypothetical protein
MITKIDFKKERYNSDLIIGTFNLQKSNSCALLEEWIAAKGAIPAGYEAYLEEHRERLLAEGDYWNEEELKMHFLSHIFFLAKMNEPSKIKLFYERIFKDTVEGQDLSVVCDCMLATPLGINTPKAPYFFLQEFKRAKKNDDPEGQMLLAMLIAQEKNKDEKPVFGCWIQGSYWRFTTLIGKHYCVSTTFDATIPASLHQIIYMLQKLRTMLLTR